MGKLKFLILIFILFACETEDTNPSLDLYNEWRWTMTTFDTRGKTITAQESDTTYFYTFHKDGTLEMKDINKQTQRTIHFEIIEGGPFSQIALDDAGSVWGYSIKNKTLSVWDPVSSFPKTMVFEVN